MAKCLDHKVVIFRPLKYVKLTWQLQSAFWFAEILVSVFGCYNITYMSI